MRGCCSLHGNSGVGVAHELDPHVASLAAATWMAAGGIGHKRDGGWSVFWPQYLALTWAWVHGIVVGILMIRKGLRSAGPPE